MTGDRLTPTDLEEAERFAKLDLGGNLGQRAAARRKLQLVREVRRLRQLDAPVTAEPGDVLQRLYDSEINARVKWYGTVA